MNDFNRTNPSVLGFRLYRPAPYETCDACGARGWQTCSMFVCGPSHACSEECAAELGYAADAERAPTADRAAILRSRQSDVATVFRAAGLI